MIGAWVVPFVTIALTQVAVIATSIYLHRALAHRSLKVHPVADVAFRVALWLTTVIGNNGSRSIASPTPSRTGVTAQPAAPGGSGASTVQRRLLRPRAAMPRPSRRLPRTSGPIGSIARSFRTVSSA
jgi:hypothetical protein